MSQDSIHDVLFIIRSHPQQVQSLLDDLDNKAELEKTTGPEQLNVIVQFVQQQNILYSSILNCTKRLGQILLIQYTTKGVLSWKDPPVQWLFHLLHQVLKHGLKIKRNLFGYKKSYWDFIWTGYQYSPKTNSTLEDYPALSNKIQSLSAQVTGISGIVFIIHSLINQRLDQRLGLLLNQPQLLKDWYEPYAFILQDQMVLFNGLLVILNNIKFDLGFQHEFLLELNEAFSGESMSEVTLVEWLPKFEAKLKDQLNDSSDSQSEVEDDISSNVSKDENIDKELQDLADFQIKEERESIINIENYSNNIFNQSSHGSKELDVLQPKGSPLDIQSPPIVNSQLSSSVSPTSLITPLSPKGSTSPATYIEEEDHLPPIVMLPKLDDKENAINTPTQAVPLHISESLLIPLPMSPEQSHSTIDYSPKSLPPDQISLPPSIDSLDGQLESEHPDIIHWKRHVEKLESEIVTLRKINFSHLTKLNSIQAQNAELNTTIKTKDSELLNFKSELNKFDTSKVALESKLADSDHQVEYLSEQLEQKNAHIQQLNQKLAKSNNENIEYQCVSQSLSHKIKQMEMQIEQLSKTNSELKSEKDKLENQVHHQDSMLELFAMEMAQSKLNLKDLEMYVGNQNNKIPWVDSQLVTKCTKCQSQFTMINRKHHCRRDGKVYCNNCTKFRWTLPSDPKPSRVCEDCYLELTDAK